MTNIKLISTLLFFIFVFKKGVCQKTGNPYIDAKKSQSEIMAEENRKTLAKQKKAYKDQMQKNKEAYMDGNRKFYNKKPTIKRNKRNLKKIHRSKNRI